MNAYFWFLFIASGVPVYYPIKKLLARKEITMLDVCMFFSFLYFWLIPMQGFLNTDIVRDYETHEYTSFAICLYMYVLLLLCKFADSRKHTPLHLSFQFCKVGDMRVKASFLWFAFFYIIFILFNLTNYSALDKNNLEGNVAFVYGLEQGFFQKILSTSYRPFFPVLFIILYNIKTTNLFYRLFKRICILLLLLSIILGAKTDLTFCLVFWIFYFYSIHRSKIQRMHYVYVVGAFAFLFLVFFPLSQSFRQYKQDAVLKHQSHAFNDIVGGYVEEGLSKTQEEKIVRYQNLRSLNVYDAVDFASSRTKFRGNGLLFMSVWQYLVPQRAKKEGIGGIMARLMGAYDVGESMLSWSILDFGVVLGPLFALLHMLILPLFTFYVGNYFNRIIKSPVYPLVVISMMMIYFVNIEHNPYLDVKNLYSIYLPVLLFVGLMLYLFKRKPILYKKQQPHD